MCLRHTFFFLWPNFISKNLFILKHFNFNFTDDQREAAGTVARNPQQWHSLTTQPNTKEYIETPTLPDFKMAAADINNLEESLNDSSIKYSQEDKECLDLMLRLQQDFEPRNLRDACAALTKLFKHGT